MSKLFGKREEAKSVGNEALAYGFKILLNLLYGRFGTFPFSQIGFGKNINDLRPHPHPLLIEKLRDKTNGIF